MIKRWPVTGGMAAVLATAAVLYIYFYSPDRKPIPADTGNVTPTSPTVKPAQDDPWRALAEGSHHFEAERFAEAIQVYQSVVTRFPDFKEAYASLGHALVARQKHDEAIDAYTKAIKLDEAYVGAYLGRGWVRWFTGDLAGAANDYRALARLDPDNSIVFGELERVLLELGQPQDVVELWRKQTERRPESVEAQVKLLEAFERVGAWQDLQQQASRLLERDDFKNNAQLHYLVGRASNEMRAYSDAISALKKATTLASNADDSRQRAHFQQYAAELAYSYLWSGDQAKFREWMQRASQGSGGGH